MKKVNLPGNQEKIDVAEPKGIINKADFKKLRKMKNEGPDHEVSMAQSSLQAIIEAAQELMAKLGDDERNIPGWIQNHITNAENYIEQAAQGFHELHGEDSPEDLSLSKMMEELKPSAEKKKPITNISQLQKKFRDISVQLPKIKGIDAKEATNISNLLDDILSKLSKGSIGTSIGKSSDYFNKSTNMQ